MNRFLFPILTIFLFSPVGLAHAQQVLFEETFENEPVGATSLSGPWTLQSTGSKPIAGEVVSDREPAAARQAAEGRQYWRWSYPNRQEAGIPTSSIQVAGWRRDPAPGIFILSQRVYVAVGTSAINDRMEPDYFIYLLDGKGNRGASLTLQTTGDYAGSNRADGRDIRYYDGEKYVSLEGSNWSRDQWLMVIVTLDEIQKNWSFIVADQKGHPIAAAENLAYSGSGFSRLESMRLHVHPGHINRGVDVWVDDIQIVRSVP